jgi:hypothetical protein
VALATTMDSEAGISVSRFLGDRYSACLDFSCPFRMPSQTGNPRNRTMRRGFSTYAAVMLRSNFCPPKKQL